MFNFSFKKIVYLLIVLLITTSLAVGCKRRKEPVTPKVNYLQVGSDTTYPPFEYLEDGEPTGFDIDIAREISKRLGKELKIISTDWENLFSELNQKKYDMVISALIISEESAKKIDFSDPYIAANQAIVTLKDSEIKGKEDLSGKVVGVEADTTAELIAEKVSGLKRLKKYENSEEAIKELEAQSIDALVSDFLVISNTLKKKPDLKVASQIVANEKYGIAFRKGDELRERVNKILTQIKKDGTYDRIYKNWFGSQE